MQYINDDRLFEEAHNHMIHRLNYFKNLSNNDKIKQLQNTLADFDNYYH